MLHFSNAGLRNRPGQGTKTVVDVLQGTAGDAAYTSALINSGACILDWQLHEERLTRSLQLLHEDHTHLYQFLFASLSHCAADALPSALQQAIRRAARPLVLAAMQAWLADLRALPAMLVCVVQSAAPPLLLHVDVMIKPAPSPTLGRALKVVVLGGPRRLPGAKHTGWVHERAALERAQPPEADEVLLADEEGKLLEGLITNFAVIQEVAQEPCLVTASPAAALPGLLLHRVVQAAAQLGLPVVRCGPSPAHRLAWREAFTMNCVRGIQPVSHIWVPPGGEGGGWELQVPGPWPGPHTLRLQRALAQLQVAWDVEQLAAQCGSGSNSTD
ncbi:aminotransferase, partial [Haematococcus lacustris]